MSDESRMKIETWHRGRKIKGEELVKEQTPALLFLVFSEN